MELEFTVCADIAFPSKKTFLSPTVCYFLMIECERRIKSVIQNAKEIQPFKDTMEGFQQEGIIECRL